MLAQRVLSHVDATEDDLRHIEGILVRTFGNEQKCMGELRVFWLEYLGMSKSVWEKSNFQPSVSHLFG